MGHWYFTEEVSEATVSFWLLLSVLLQAVIGTTAATTESKKIFFIIA
jgi:hypothetical protein